MRIFFILLIFFIAISSCQRSVKKENAVLIDNDLKQVIDDVIYQLNLVDKGYARNVKFQFKPYSEFSRKIPQSKYAFGIKVSSSDEIIIYGNNKSAQEFGMYQFLENLGYKFYFPGELWTIRPKDLKTEPYEKEYTPTFVNNNFFGGGGFPINHPADPSNYVKTSWETWKKRNRFYESFTIGGHYWQSFIFKNKDIIAKHPEYVSASGKQLCVTNKDVQNLFVKDILQNIHNNIQTFGKNHALASGVSIEPNDGGEHCDCKECKKLGSVSNRVFYFSNLVAKEIKKNFPDVFVSVFAYNEHAAVPDFKLEDNLYVTIVPYAFQDEAAPQKFIVSWTDHHKNVGIYDYWGVMIWNKCQPFKNFMYTAQDKVKLWKKLGIRHIYIESTYGIGEAGIPLYLLSKHGWEGNVDGEKYLNAMFTDLFGAAGAKMKTIFTRWSNNFDLKLEKHLSFFELKEAIQIASTKEEKARIQSFSEYFDFLRFLENIENTQPNSASRKNAIETTINYSYSIMPSLMIHSYWVPHPFIVLYGNGEKEYWQHRNVEQSKGQAYWTSLNTKNLSQNLPLLDKSIYNEINEGARNLKVAARSVNDHEAALASIPNKPRTINTINSFEWYYDCVQFKKFTFDISLEKFPNELLKGAINLSVYDEEDNLISTIRYLPGKQYKAEELLIKSPGRYRIEFRISNGTMHLKWNDCRGIELVPGTEVDFGEYYIYLGNTNHLNFTCGLLPIFFIGDKQIEPIKIDKVYKIDAFEKNIIIAKGGTIINPLNSIKIYLN